MARTAPLVRIVLTATTALLGVTGLAACGLVGSNDTTDMAWDAQALQAIGYTTEDVSVANDPQPAATNDPRERRPRHQRLRYAFRHALHGEAVVQTDEGTKTVVVQRGKVTAVDGTSLTVLSTDGFSLTWKVGDPVHVVVNRAKAELSAITVGAEVGVAGAKDGNTPVARLIVVPKNP
jgi:hypothetical protein